MGTRKEEVKRNSDIAQSLVQQDLIMEELRDIRREQILLRKGAEAGIYGEEVADMEDVDMDEVPAKESE